MAQEISNAWSTPQGPLEKSKEPQQPKGQPETDNNPEEAPASPPEIDPHAWDVVGFVVVAFILGTLFLQYVKNQRTAHSAEAI